jgi:hypothetical protein
MSWLGTNAWVVVAAVSIVTATLFAAGLVWLGLYALRMIWRLARAPAEAPAPAAAAPPDLANDPELQRFFARVDPTFRRPQIQPRQRPVFPPSPQAPAAPPQVIAERPDPQLIWTAPDPIPSSVRRDPIQLYASPMMDQPPLGAVPPAGRHPAPSPAAKTPTTPAAPDAQLAAITKMWPLLSADDRRELFQIALLKVKRTLGK